MIRLRSPDPFFLFSFFLFFFFFLFSDPFFFFFYDAIRPMLVEGYDTWYVTHTCADYARDVYYKATGVYLDVDDYMGIETPRELARSIGN